MPAWTQPRVAPPQLLPTVAGTFVVVLALPVFALAGWRLTGWAIGAVLWIGFEALGWFLSRLRARTGNLAAAGVAGFLMLFRALTVMVVVLVLVTSDKWLGVAALLTYAAGYTAQLGLSLVAYYTGPEAGEARTVTRLRTLALVGATAGMTALAMPSVASARGKFDPSDDFELHDWIPIHLGPLDLSVTKAVVYLWLGALLSILLGIGLMRGRRLNRRQALGEMIYDIAQTQVAEQGLPSKHVKRWFPYVATLMIFIFMINLIGFVPLPFGEKYHGLPTFGIYAATSSLAVTLALALMTFVFTHIEGIRWNGPVKYFRSWIPEVPKVMLPLIIPLEILGQFMRIISLSVRLYANMLAGHMLILTFIGLGFVLTNVVVAVFGTIFATIFYLFEVVIVVGIQAFIFAALSAIYIGSAIEPEH